eukprot:243456-Prorocentrum_minimum.AAC.1
MVSYWGSFAHGGAPSYGGVDEVGGEWPAWPPLLHNDTYASLVAMELDAPRPRLRRNYRAKACEFW